MIEVDITCPRCGYKGKPDCSLRCPRCYELLIIHSKNAIIRTYIRPAKR